MNVRITAGCALLLASMVPATPALAWPFFDVTASEVLSVDPPRVKTTFTITETGPTDPGSCGWAAFSVQAADPGAPDAPQLFACEGESPWNCVLATYGGTPTIDFFPNGGSGDHRLGSTFSIVTDRAEPCVRVEYLCVVLMGAPSAPFEACLAVDMPVPADPSSWGRLKVRYR